MLRFFLTEEVKAMRSAPSSAEQVTAVCRQRHLSPPYRTSLPYWIRQYIYAKRRQRLPLVWTREEIKRRWGRWKAAIQRQAGI